MLMAYAIVDRWMEHLANGHRIQLPGFGHFSPWIRPGWNDERGPRRTARRISFFPSNRMRRLAAAILEEQLTQLGVGPYGDPRTNPKYDSPAARASKGANRVQRP